MTTEITLNGVVVTPFKKWALNLIRREAAGEQLEKVSTEAWREVLNYGKDAEAKAVLAEVRKAEAQKEAA